MLRRYLLLCAALFFGQILAGAAGSKVLVLLEHLKYKNTHSSFFSSLVDRGYNLDFKLVSDSSLKLKAYDSWFYDKVVIFASDVQEFGGQIDSSTLLEFVDAGHDMLLAFDSRVSEEMRDLAAECGVDVEPKGTAVIDQFNFAQNMGFDRTVVLTTDVIQSNAVVEPLQAPVMYQGVALTIPPESELVLRALGASSSAYSAVPGKAPLESLNVAGRDITLMALVQARNNARVVVAGSIAMFSNEFYQSVVVPAAGKRHWKGGNEELCTEVSRWGFHERGVLLPGHMRHVLQDTGESQPIYRVNDKIVFSIDIMERNGSELLPFRADDFQVELVMLDPYVRKTLSHDDKGTFSTEIHVPDVYGVFKFVVDYKRPGYSYIHLEEQVPIRPYKHNEYERFIVSAYPYYASSFSMMAGFFVLGLFFLYSK